LRCVTLLAICIRPYTVGGDPDAAPDKMPFYMLALDLPPPPLFQDVMEKNIIPQVGPSA